MKLRLLNDSPHMSPPFHQSIEIEIKSSWFLGLQRLFWAGIVIALLIRGGGYAQLTLFNHLEGWDDEGYVMITVKQFIEGYPLYDRVFSQYGPFFYLFDKLVFALARAPVDHTSIRNLLIGQWVLTAFLGLLSTLRITRSYTLAISAYVFLQVYIGIGLGSEPGHPQGLCCLLIGIAVAACAFLAPLWKAWILVGLGMVTGSLLLIKINLGLYLFLGLMLAFLAAVRPAPSLRVFKILFGFGILLFPAVLMKRHLSEPWGQAYCGLVTLSLLSIFWAVWTYQPSRPMPIKRYMIYLASLTGTIALIVLTTRWSGTTWQGMLHGVLLNPLRLSGTFYHPAPVAPYQIWLALGSMLLAAVYAGLLRKNSARNPIAGYLLLTAKLVFGIFVLYSVYFNRVEWLLDWTMPFLWLGLITDRSEEQEPNSPVYFARVALVCIAGWQSLQAYPVAGSQLWFSTFLYILVAMACLGDVIVWAGKILQGLFKSAISYRLCVGACCALIIFYCVFSYQERINGGRSYRSTRFALGLPGAKRLYLSEAETATYRWLTYNLQTLSDTFFSFPGLNSLYFWTQKEPPTQWNCGAWMTLLDSRQQQAIVDALARYPQACVVRHEALAGAWLRDQVIDDLPLVKYIRNAFEPVGRFGKYEFLVRRGRKPVALTYCARRIDFPPPFEPSRDPWPRDVGGPPAAATPSSIQFISLSIPAMRDAIVHRIHIYDLKSGQIIADTLHCSGPQVLVARDISGQIIQWPPQPGAEGITLSQPRELVLQISTNEDWSRRAYSVVRLLDAQSRIIGSLPLVR